MINPRIAQPLVFKGDQNDIAWSVPRLGLRFPRLGLRFGSLRPTSQIHDES